MSYHSAVPLNVSVNLVSLRVKVTVIRTDCAPTSRSRHKNLHVQIGALSQQLL